MSPRDERGAVPIAKLAELDSAAHHLREQADRDRRTQAERNRDHADRFDRLEDGHNAIRLEVSRVSDTCKRLEFQAGVQTETQSKILDYISQQRGSLRVLKFLLGGGVVFEVARLVMEQAK
jgi:hypothetical protein